MADVKVGVELKTVPDGFLKEPATDPDTLVVSVLMMPVPLSAKGKTGTDLGTWPGDVAALNGSSLKLKVRFGRSTKDAKDVTAAVMPLLAAPDWGEVNNLWGDIIGLTGKYGPVDKKIYEALRPEPSRSKSGGENAYNGTIHSYPAAALATTLSLASGAISALQMVQMLDASIAPKALNPLSRSALHSSAFKSLFTLRDTVSVSDWLSDRASSSSDANKRDAHRDAMLRIAWAGRQTPRPRVASLDRDTEVAKWLREIKDLEETRSKAPDNIFEGLTRAIEERQKNIEDRVGPAFPSAIERVRIQTDLAELLEGEIDLAFKRARGPGNRSDLMNKYPEEAAAAYVTFLADPGVGTLGFTNSTDANAEIGDRLIDGLLGLDEPGLIRTKLTAGRATDPAAALAAYEFTMMPERAAFLETVAASGIFVPPSLVKILDDNAGPGGIDDQSSSIFRRLTGILAYPDVARLFGLIVDVKVTKRALEDALRELGWTGQGAFSVEAVLDGMTPTDNSSPIASAESNSFPTMTLLGNGVFEAASLYALAKSVPGAPPGLKSIANLEDGLLKLGLGGYRVVDVDVNAGIEGSVRSTRNDKTSLENGELVSDLPSPAKAMRTAGIALLDTDILTRAELEKAIATLRDDQKDEVEWQSLFLEDLVAGYRVDIEETRDSAPKWRSLTNRSVRFPQIEAKLGAGFSPATEHSKARERMNGYVRTVHREYETGDEHQPSPTAAVYETMATWRNWSLAVPARPQI